MIQLKKEDLPNGVLTYWTRVSDITHLYSETISDPVLEAEDDAPKLAVDKEGNPLPYHIEVIPRPVNKVETRILVFHNEDAKMRYLLGL